MSGTTHKVSIFALVKRKVTKGYAYSVRWRVDGAPKDFWKGGFKNDTAAEGFRAKLRVALNNGEPFDLITGLPASMRRAPQRTWYVFACEYVDHAWAASAATSRSTVAEALTAVTEAMFPTDTKGRPDGRVLRVALTRWAFNTKRRDSIAMPPEVQGALKWAAKNSLPVSAFTDAEVRAAVLARITTNLDGKPTAPTRAARTRGILRAALGWAVERKLLAENPLPPAKKSEGRSGMVRAIDKRAVPNPVQSRVLLDAIGARPQSGRRLKPFFACIYYSALRPEEVAALGKTNLAGIPREGFGEFHLDGARPHAGSEWTDSGEQRDDRQLKHRGRDEWRTAPCPPELTALLWGYIDEFGFRDDGRLFAGARGGDVSRSAVYRVWHNAREAAFTPEVVAGPLARSPYDFRHAAVTTWLRGGVEAGQVAEWAGHSLDVLNRVYAAWLDGNAELNRRRIQAALGHKDIF